MYNGIGLPTPRGSGTNGYVQRNLSAVRHKKDRTDYKSEEELRKLESSLVKKPNQDILDHERKRKVELKCLELAELMEEQGYGEGEIQEKVATFRMMLLEKDIAVVKEGEQPQKPTVTETHQLAEANEKKNERLRAAFGISDNYVDGSSFDPNRRAKEAAVAAAAAKQQQEQQKQYSLVKESSSSRSPSPKQKKKKKKKDRGRSESRSPSRRERKKSSKKKKHRSESKKRKHRSPSPKSKHKSKDKKRKRSTSESASQKGRRDRSSSPDGYHPALIFPENKHYKTKWDTLFKETLGQQHSQSPSHSGILGVLVQKRDFSKPHFWSCPTATCPFCSKWPLVAQVATARAWVGDQTLVQKGGICVSETETHESKRALVLTGPSQHPFLLAQIYSILPPGKELHYRCWNSQRSIMTSLPDSLRTNMSYVHAECDLWSLWRCLERHLVWLCRTNAGLIRPKHVGRNFRKSMTILELYTSVIIKDYEKNLQELHFQKRATSTYVYTSNE
ncbi:hypothetical protein JRQ81_005625 [Phrynocephalus forsythii]|uniref:CWF21 domain-containing protein n=1 Tax=Phrynocephalus forsythii TaxID=171643 RepID=A0A9Q0XHA2_9SAUR|nr:hypothetical protein JRQ81_005625 [Phrynocephalus forsythii]